MQKSSHLIWNLIGGEDRTQDVFDDIVRSVLLYKFKNLKSGLFSVDPVLTDAIFDLNSQDEVPMPMYDIVINGQKLKELFITNIFAKALENLEAYNGKIMFMTLPSEDRGVDTGIFSVDPDGYYKDKQGNIVITKESTRHIFQVKEYLNYRQFKKQKFTYAKPLEPDFFHIEKLKIYTEEIILIYIRDYRIFSTPELKKIFKDLKNKKIYVLLSFLADLPQDDGTTLRHKANHYNFLIMDVWSELGRVIHVWFKEPKSFKRL